LHDIELFKEPPSKHGDCPICFERLPTLDAGRRYNTCCGKVICSGCVHAPVYDNQGNEVIEKTCPFCRTPWPESNNEIMKRMNKRLELNDPTAMYNKGCDYEEGLHGLSKDYTKALEFYHRAAELSHADAYCNIGYAYDNGLGVKVDKKKARKYYELAAMEGDAQARHNLGIDEAQAGNLDRAIKHWMIAVSIGDSESLNCIKNFYSFGKATKEDYMKALQSYQTYLGEIKSKQRDEAAAAQEGYRYY